jgi:Zn-dependent protease/predicted transcriptional regulator
MKGSLYIGKISGIKLFIHWTFLILIFWIIFSGARHGNNIKEILLNLGFVAAVFLCIILHEFGHALTAKRFHFKTRDITLLPIGGLARMESLPEKPFQEFLVAVMGPVVNLVISLILFIILKQTNQFPDSFFDENVTEWNFWFQLYAVNLFLALFNFIPAFPMDGGRILRALLSIKLSRSRATGIAAIIGQSIAVLFVFAGFLYNPVLVFIGLFVFIVAKAEAKMEEAKEMLGDVKVKDLLMHNYSVLHPEDPLSKAVTLLLDSQEKSFVVKENGTVKGILSTKEIIEGLSKFGPDIPVNQVMKTKIITLQEEDKVNEIMTKASDGTSTLMPVFHDNVMIGVLNLENINEFILIQSALKIVGKLKLE